MNSPLTVNNDGYLDISAWNASANAFYGYLNNKNGTFHLQASNILSSGVQSMVAGDFNHDGYIDLAFLTNCVGGRQLHIFFTITPPASASDQSPPCRSSAS